MDPKALKEGFCGTPFSIGSGAGAAALGRDGAGAGAAELGTDGGGVVTTLGVSGDLFPASTPMAATGCCSAVVFSYSISAAGCGGLPDKSTSFICEMYLERFEMMKAWTIRFPF